MMQWLKNIDWETVIGVMILSVMISGIIGMGIFIVYAGKLVDERQEMAVLKATAIDYPDSLEAYRAKVIQLEGSRTIWANTCWVLLKYQAGEFSADSLDAHMKKYFVEGSSILNYYRVVARANEKEREE